MQTELTPTAHPDPLTQPAERAPNPSTPTAESSEDPLAQGQAPDTVERQAQDAAEEQPQALALINEQDVAPRTSSIPHLRNSNRPSLEIDIPPTNDPQRNNNQPRRSPSSSPQSPSRPSCGSAVCKLISDNPLRSAFTAIGLVSLGIGLSCALWPAATAVAAVGLAGLGIYAMTPALIGLMSAAISFLSLSILTLASMILYRKCTTTDDAPTPESRSTRVRLYARRSSSDSELPNARTEPTRFSRMAFALRHPF